MADINEMCEEKGDLTDFITANDLIDSIDLLNPTLHTYPTYLWGKERLVEFL